MPGLSAAEVVGVWDLASGEKSAATRLLLQKARPDLAADQIDDMTVGGRAYWLLELRRATFGETVRGLVSCPGCDQRLTLAVDSSHLTRWPLAGDGAGAVPLIVETGDVEVEARIPDGRAIMAAAACPDVDSARTTLIKHCLIRAWTSAGDIPIAALDPDVVDQVGTALVAADPQSEVQLGAACAGCGYQLVATFDIESFLWAEVSNLAVHLLDEVHALASGYGWSEDQILDLSSRRRRYYTEKLVGG